MIIIWRDIWSLIGSIILLQQLLNRYAIVSHNANVMCHGISLKLMQHFS